MFGKEKEEKKKSGGEVTGFIGKGMSIVGSLSFEDTVRIDGSFRGEISATGTLVVGDGGFVEGEIKAGSAIITGTVNGNLSATTKVELRRPARFTGEIKTPTLIIDEGVIFDGTCVMVKKEGASYETIQYGDTGQDRALAQ